MKRPKGNRTFCFPGQAPVTPNAGKSHNYTHCWGYEGYQCPKLIEPCGGVLQPRCPECFKKHIEQVRANHA